MRYVYDTIIKKEQSRLKYQGLSYKLDKRTSMGDKYFYSFVSSAGGVLLVIPCFYELYLEAVKKFEKFPKTASLEKYEARIRKSFSSGYDVEESPSDIHPDACVKIFHVPYKDIQLYFSFEDDVLTMLEKFKILNNRITGEQNEVLLGEEDED